MSLQVYKASAGSGKTFQLALEYIALALESGSPSAFSNILAVTFTNKATAEMKDRILAQLYNLAHGGKDKGFLKELQKKLPLSQNEIEQRADRTLHAIVHDYDRFRVETIDSFFQSLLTNLAHELNLTRGFRVNLDSDEAISKAVDHMLVSIGTKDGASKNVTEMILNYMEEQIDDDKGWNISKQLKAFAESNLFNEEYLKNEENLNKELSDNDKIKKLKKKLYLQKKEFSEPLQKAAKELLDILENPFGGADPQNLKSYKGICTYLQQIIKEDFYKELQGKTILDALENSEVLLKKDVIDNADYQELARIVVTRLQDIEQKRLDAVPFIATDSLIMQNLVPLFLLNEIGRQVTYISNETGSFLLAKTPDLFNKMVRKEDSSFVFEKSGTTFKHVMIDEFQDTSGTQWQNFKKLLIENMSQGDESMLVGDIKQSIYRWRGGKWEILGNIEQEMAHNGNVKVTRLSTNYRSQKAVVKFNNDFFQNLIEKFPENLMAPDYEKTVETITHIYQDVKQDVKNNADGGYVRVALVDKKVDDEELMEDVYEQIVLLNQEKKIPFDKIGILVRRRSEAVKLVEYFATQHPEVPLTSDEAFQLSASPAVRLLICALKYLYDEKDTVALELVRLMAENLSKASGLTLKCDLEELKEQRTVLINMPLFELCQQLIQYFNLPQTEDAGVGQSAYLYSFLDQVLDFVDNKSSDLGAFIEFWDEFLYKKAIAVDIKNSIYVMTVHKSKGLQRHTILIPFCNWCTDEDFPNDILWCNTRHLPEPFNELPLVPVNTYNSTKIKSSAFKSHYAKEHMELCIDAINTLYVAFTRAEENLFIWSKPGRRLNSAYALVRRFIHPDEDYPNDNKTQKKTKNKKTEESEECAWEITPFGELQTYVEETDNFSDNPLDTSNSAPLNLSLSGASTPTEFRQSNQAKDFISDLSVEKSDEDAIQNDDSETKQAETHQSYIDKGKLLHQLFSFIETPQDVDKAILSLTQQGLISESQTAEKIKKFVEKRINDSQARTWFDGSWKLFTECNILWRNSQGKVIQCRPDRVMKKGNETIVIDYKFGTFNNKYVTQVQGYMNALKKMGHKNVKGYLWFVYSGEIREVYEEQ